jgi:dTDP-N-acetylfucosamine:lipid II N-acetylfucosaminyltransferase
MNLHIVPDNVFTNRFYENIVELDILDKNKIIVRSSSEKYVHIKHDIVGAPMYSVEFDSYVGDLNQYEKVFIHMFSPLMYRWVAKNSFKELNWMIWGADLYNLPSNDLDLYDTLTYEKYIRHKWSFKNLLYLLKIRFTNSSFKEQAYAKVDNILTWMTSEFDFACAHLPLSKRVKHKFFFYENKFAYETLDKYRHEADSVKSDIPTIVIGNSSTATLNHIDVVNYLQENAIKAHLLIPVSYGDTHYTDFLRKNLSFYTYGKVELVDRYMAFEEYVTFLMSADAIIMYNTRPQGYGNIFIMMYLEKPVILNEKNISVVDLDKNSLKWYSLSDLLKNEELDVSGNRKAVTELLSHKKLLEIYSNLFS